MSEISDFLKQLNIKLPTSLDTNLPVILVEQQQDVRLIVAHHMKKMQFHKVYQAKNGLDAIEKVKDLAQNKERIGLVIAQWDTPVMNGMDFLNELKQSFELNRPAFCISIDEVTKEKLMYAVEQGVDEVLAKPFTLSDLMPKIRSAFKTFNNPSNPEQIYELAKDMLRRGQVDQATKIYQRLSDINKQTARPLVGLAKISFEKKEYEPALKLLADACKRNPNFVHAFALSGEIYAAMGDSAKALAAFKKAIDISPLNPLRYLNAADILTKEQKFQEVVDLLKVAQQHQLKFPELHKHLSNAYFNLKDYPAALSSIKVALADDPDNTDFINQHAIALKSLGQVEEAVKEYNKIIKLDPTDHRALYNKAILYKDSGNIAEAIHTLERVVERFPDFELGKTKLEELKAKPAA